MALFDAVTDAVSADVPVMDGDTPWVSELVGDGVVVAVTVGDTEGELDGVGLLEANRGAHARLTRLKCTLGGWYSSVEVLAPST